MKTLPPPFGRLCQGVALFACAALIGLGSWSAPADAQKKIEVLRIGASGGLTSDKAEKKDQSALKELKLFIKEETGLTNDILDMKDWVELTDKMAGGEMHLGVYQGFEFAAAVEKNPNLKPLALAVNVYRYPVGYL